MKGLADILHKIQIGEKNITDAHTEICHLFKKQLKSDSEKFSFADMEAAFDYGANSGHRYDAMTFTEWISKR